MKRSHSLILAIVLGLALPGAVVQAQDDFDAVEIETAPLADGIFMLTGAGGNMGLVVGDDGAFLVDDQYAPLTAKIRAAVAAVTDQEITFVFNTHYHGDHTGGNESLGETGSHLVSHTNVRRRLSSDQYSTLLKRTAEAAAPGALPTITFTDSLTFYFGAQEIVAFHVPHAHTDGDGVLHFPGANVIHAGDVVFYGLYPYIDTSAGGSIDGMIAGVERILDLCDAETQIIPGHGPLLDREQLQEYLAMLRGARAKVAAAMSGGRGLEAVVAARPCAEWDEALGHVWLTSDQFVESIFTSLSGPHHEHH
jgi:glyoxylase-like metal-dependent hydrolase (beta-lactamase superfamily II)